MKIFIEEQKFNQPFVLIGLSVAFIVVSITTFQNWEAINQESLSSKTHKIILDNNQYRQGRSKEQVESSYLGASIAIGALVFLTLIAIIFS